MANDDRPLCELIDYSQVANTVHLFYRKLIEHERLGKFFSNIENFEHHEKRITDFWWQSMGGKLDNPPQIDMIGKHFALGIQQQDLETWLALFSETLGETLDDAPARKWMDKALHIAARLKQIVIDHKPMGIQIRNKP